MVFCGVAVALSANEQFRYWGIGAVVFLLFVWMMGDVLLPFITGMAIAYFLTLWLIDWRR